jgi:hypothetical protein
MSEPYIAFDLDGTLAHYDGWMGPNHIGAPVEPIVSIARGYLANGVKIKILTARACDPDPSVVPAIQAWCKEHLGQVVEVTNKKDYAMLLLYDDRAVAVEKNTGRTFTFTRSILEALVAT